MKEPQQQQRRGHRSSGSTSSNHHRVLLLLIIDATILLMGLAGLLWFSSSFFLARRSLSQRSDCDEAASLLRKALGLSDTEVARALSSSSHSTTTTDYHHGNGTTTTRQGCWMDRRVDSMILLVVDALRFDFAYYNLPQSIGRRLAPLRGDDEGAASAASATTSSSSSSSRLFQFVADPPTVTMQRLKALTTGSLPTFADIGGSFGGAAVDEDNWPQALANIDGRRRGLVASSRTAFVGDDTWEDLYPHVFTESHPYPSFNTRDLDTVDNGCLWHLPGLVRRLRGMNDNDDKTTTEQPQQQPKPDEDDPQDKDDELELVVVHFLGVDHVGHTYGPHNEHMDGKLKQMDQALSLVLDALDNNSTKCHAAFILGDHGMTEQGNHGGGTTEEINAALFVHVSPACGGLPRTAITNELEQYATSSWLSQSVATMHQIDLVPTIALLLGLPLPFANLGGLSPALLPGLDDDGTTTALALALNAAQVWRYLTAYSATANRLPDLNVLGDKLALAVDQYRAALAIAAAAKDHEEERDNDAFRQACGLLKSFLNDALELGQRVWTRFDDRGMMAGSAVLLVALGLYARDFLFLFLLATFIPASATTTTIRIATAAWWEVSLSMVAMVFLCGALTFSNSYILEEENVTMYFLSTISAALAFRLYCDPRQTNLWMGALLLPIASRISELFVSGHGLDPAISMHGAHASPVFVGSLALLVGFRWLLFQRLRVLPSRSHAIADCAALTVLAWSWLEKRIAHSNSNGYWQAQVVLTLVSVGLIVATGQAVLRYSSKSATDDMGQFGRGLTVLFKLYIAILVVTGPATAASLVLYVFQVAVIVQLAEVGPTATTTTPATHSLVIATLLKLVTRHAFFATNHGCAFNRLQYSAAFVTTNEFHFVIGGISLFLNTFGWEMAGIILAGLLSQTSHHRGLWRVYGSWQMVEALASCLSVSVLRRHLMVWDIYAPHFLFVAIFTVLNLLSQLSAIAIAAVSP